MMFRWFMLALALSCTSSLAGITTLDAAAEQPELTVEQATAALTDEEILALMRAQFNGLEGFLPTGTPPPPAPCDANRAPVTRALLIAAENVGMGSRFRLSGPPNDTEFLRNALIAHGAHPENLMRLTGQSAGYPGVAEAATNLVAATDCGDSVILHFTGFAWPAGYIAAATEPGGPFSNAATTAKTRSLASLETVGTKRGTPADWLNLTAPFAILNQSTEGMGDILSAAAISELVTQLRNRGANVTVVLDLEAATEFNIEDRQAQVDPRRMWRDVFVPETSDASVNPFPPSQLNSAAGSLTVLYGTAYGQMATERKLPRGAKDRKSYGVFSFQLASAILQSERTTAVALMRHLKTTADGFSQNYTFSTTDPEHELVAEAQVAAPLRKGEIRIIDPAPTRAATALKDPEVTLRGIVEAPADTMIVTVNGQTAQSSPDGKFTANLTLQAGVNRIDVLAMTRDSQPITHSFELFYEGDMAALLGTGARYAVMIANQDYVDGSGLPKLTTPIGDAEAIAEDLRTRYGFVTETQDEAGQPLNLFLRNANRVEIETLLYQVSRIAGARDTVLIFYAGHGIYEQATQGAFWLPIDARAGLPPSYLSAATISDAILRLEAGNVLVISDSCYSGALLRGGGTTETVTGDRLRALQRLADKRSRIVIASGGNEPVADGGGDGHSVFARALLTGLEDMDEDAFSARELFDRFLLPMVVGQAAQEPQYRPIERSGHEGGDVVFARLSPVD